MARGRKLSASSIRERVENFFGVDDNPYGLPPLMRNPKSNNKLFGIQDPSHIPVIGKLLPKPKQKFTRRRRSSSLPARYKAIFAENPPDMEILPEHFEDFDKREKAFYEQYPDLKPCMTAEEYEIEFAKWDATCNIRHLKEKPPKLLRWERQFGSRELLNPRPAPRPPGFVERPVSKALPPLPPDAGDRSTCDTEFLISQFPPAPDAIPPLSGTPCVENARKPVQRQRSGSEGTPRADVAMRWCLGVQFDPIVRTPLAHKDDESFAATLTRPGLVYYLQEHEVLLPPSRGRVWSRQGYITQMAQASRTSAGFVNMFHELESTPSATEQPAVATTSMIAAELTAWGEEIAREDIAREAARAEALRKLESNQTQSQASPPQAQAVYREREHHQNERTEPTPTEETKDRRERERKNEDEHQRHVEKERQRQRLKSEPKPRHSPSSSSAGVQDKYRERQPLEENRQRKPSSSRAVDVTRMPQNVRNRREHKSEKEHQRERNKSEPKRQVPPSSGSVVVHEKRRERRPEDSARARVESKAQENARKHIVRRSVSTSRLHDMVQSKSQIVYVPAPTNTQPHRHAKAGTPPTTVPPARELPSMPITPITPSNIGVRAATAAPVTGTTPAPQGHAPKVVRPRPSRPNLGPPPSLSAGSAQRSRAPSLTQHSGEKAPALRERLVGAVLHRKVSNSSFEHKPIDKGSISAPVEHIKGAETGLFQLRHAQLYVQDLRVTMIPLPYEVQYPPTPESIAPRAKAIAAESVDGATSQVTNPVAHSSTPVSVQTAQYYAHIQHTANSSMSSASSYGSSSSHTHGYASSMTSMTHHGYVQRTYEDCISPSVGKIILPAALRKNNITSAAPRERKNSLTTMQVHLPNTGSLNGGARPPRQVNAVASSSRNIIDNSLQAAVDPESESEDEELIRGYKPRKFVDVKKMIREEQERIRRERLKELPTIPFPVAVGDTAPLRIRKKASQL